MKAPTSGSRVRETSETAARVDAIADLMREGLWLRGQSDKVFAEEWKLTPKRVRDLSAEAWRRVCSEADDAEKARPTIAGTLMTNLARADSAGKYGEVARVADVWSRVVGARAPDKVEDVTAAKERPFAEQLAIAESVVAALKSQAK